MKEYQQTAYMPISSMEQMRKLQADEAKADAVRREKRRQKEFAEIATYLEARKHHLEECARWAETLPDNQADHDLADDIGKIIEMVKSL